MPDKMKEVYPQDIFEKVILNELDIRLIAKRLAGEIQRDYLSSKKLIMVCVLKGSIFFYTDILKNITIPFQTEFLKASSYDGTRSRGKIDLFTTKTLDPKDADVVIVEDIVDTGFTIEQLTRFFVDHEAKTIEICTLLDKPSRRKNNVKPKYFGYQIDDKFVVGYGIDYNEQYRNIPVIGYLNPKYIK